MTVEGGRDREDAIELSNKVEARPGRERRVCFTKRDTGTTAAVSFAPDGCLSFGTLGSLATTILPGERHFVAYYEQTFAGLLTDLGQNSCRMVTPRQRDGHVRPYPTACRARDNDDPTGAVRREPSVLVNAAVAEGHSCCTAHGATVVS